MKTKLKALALLMLLVAAVCGVNSKEAGIIVSGRSDYIYLEPEMVPLGDLTSIPVPEAPGTSVKKNASAEIDYSNSKDGYVMVRYLKKTSKKLRVLVKGPSGVTYTYTLKSDGAYEVFPLSDGNGGYQISAHENISDNRYSTVLSASIQVKMADEFAPFLRPNQYVNYNKNSAVVKKAAELTKSSDDLLEKISAVYGYVTDNITYDKDLAATVQKGYVPDVDAVLKKGRGICFDYAAVMAAMLRSQMIPTKLVIGYTGDIYHSWINVYSEETGWVDNVIYFDGETWKLMDPTFAASKTLKDRVLKYIESGSGYSAKYVY